MYIKEADKVKRQSRIVTSLIVLLPLLRYYIPGLQPIMFSDVAQLYLVFIGITRKKKTCCDPHIGIKNSLLFYGVYGIFTTIMSLFFMPVFDDSTNITMILRLWVWILIIYFTIDGLFEKTFGLQVALKVAIINSCLMLTQLILFRVFGIRTSFLIPFLNAEAGYSNERVLAARDFRPTGLFCEPSQSFYYSIPLLFILLFSIFVTKLEKNNPKGKNVLYSIILTIGIICSESGSAAMLIIIVWIFFALYYIVHKKSIKGIILLIVIVITIFNLFKLDFFVTAFDRGSNITKGSGSIRVLRGYLTWIQFPFTYKIFGIGYGNYNVYVHYAGFSTPYDYIQDIGLTNAFFTILSGLGIIGIIFLFIFFIRAYKCSKIDIPSNLLILYLFFSMFYSGIFLGTYFVLYMAYFFSRTNSDKYSENPTNIIHDSAIRNWENKYNKV